MLLILRTSFRSSIVFGYNIGMAVKTITCKLRTNPETSAALADTMERYNAACNSLSKTAWSAKAFRQFDLHKAAYYQIRSDFGLPAQLAIRAISKVSDSYKTDRSIQHSFGPRGAVTFDARCFKLKGVSSAELTTTQGRISLSLAHGGRQREQLLAGTIGEADLLFRDGNYYLAISVKTPEPPKADTSGGVLGVDLGIVEIATDSTGQSFSGSHVKAVRMRVRIHRRNLQKARSRSGYKRLQKTSRRQSRFIADTNHVIAKRLVEKAQSAKKALALEDLTGIRGRGNGFNREMRWLLGNWAFADLAAKVKYKAADLGIPVVFVDPRHTSQTCSACGHCERGNRKSQSQFQCLSCGRMLNADFNAALNIQARGLSSTALMFREDATASE